MMDASKRQSVLVNIGERFDMLRSFEQRGRSTYRVSQHRGAENRMSANLGERSRDPVKRSKSLPRLGDLIFSMMSEGRKTQVFLLDERQLEILIQPKLYAGELLDLVASHFNLKEKEYFGLSFKDDTGHHHWLQLDRKVLEHDFPKKAGPLVLYFAVRFFIESIGYLRDGATIELFYLQAKQAIYKGFIESDSETAFELAAHVLQAVHGDYIDEISTKKQLKKLPVLPTSCLQEHPSITFCEDKIIDYYKRLEDTQRGTAIVNYMSIVESLPTYGIHYYEVKDKSGIPWWLGLSHKGISLYDYADKRIPRRVFAWKQLENLYFRDKKFSIEVHDAKRIVHTLSSFNLYEDAIQESIEEFDDLSDAISDPTTQVSVSRRTFGPGNVNVHAWFASTAQLTKCIWSMAVSQHQFYLDRQQSKSQLPQVRSMSEIANDLCQSTGSLPGSANSDSISRSNSAHSLTVSLSTNNSKLSLTAEELEASRSAQRDMFAALRARKDALEEALKKRTEELKALCIQEGHLTGCLPAETPLVPGEAVPVIRKRVGTAFTLSPKIMSRDKVSEEEELLAKLELELELQDKIAKAAQRLAQDRTVSKSVRKTRKQSYNRAVQKLKDIEKKLHDFQRHAGKFPLKPQSSMEELLDVEDDYVYDEYYPNNQYYELDSEDSREFLDSDSEFISPNTTPALQRHDIRFYPKHESAQVKIITSPQVEVVEVQQQQQQRHSSPSLNRPSTPSSQGSGQRSASPVSPVKHYPAYHGASRGSTPSPGPHRHHVGYMPNSVYTTRTQYRSQMYPTFPHRTPNSAPPVEYDGNRQMSVVEQENLYNVNTHRTAHYSSVDELKTPEEGGDCYYDGDEGGMPPPPPPHGYNPAGGDNRRYGSLDRNTRLADYDFEDELSPSKFGSKRESHSDYRDSVYNDGTGRGEYVDYMPPLPPSGGFEQQPPQAQPPQAQAQTGYPQPGRVQNLQQVYEGYVEKTYGERTTVGNLPFIDSSSSHSSLHSGASSSQQFWPATRQQAAPRTPQFESPPTPFVQHEYTPQQDGVQHAHPPQSPQTESPQQPMTVTKHQRFVEVSKPFEMSDFYKYSERLRKQRRSDGGGSSGPTTPTGVRSPYVARATHFNQGNVTNQGQPQAMTPVYSQTRSRPTSPYSHPQEGSYSIHKTAPPSPSQYPARTRTQHQGNQGNQGNYAQPQYQGQQQGAAYNSHPTQLSPRHVTYQPPQPMTCVPVQDSVPNKVTGASNRPDLLEDVGDEEEEAEESMESFRDEVKAWYVKPGVAHSATLV